MPRPVPRRQSRRRRSRSPGAAGSASWVAWPSVPAQPRAKPKAITRGRGQRLMGGLAEHHRRDAGKAEGVAGGSPVCIRTPRLRHHSCEVEPPARRAMP
jgi:hypothetical protein